tara:strand:- start:515 stop:1255 length:741 start_codon:yes stop_codon:yes gene_type:complete
MISLIIQARVGSTRLPGKVLKKIGDKTILEFLIDRVRLSKTIDQIIIATSNNPSDEKIVKLCQKLNTNCFIGDEKNVLRRYHDCALKYKATTIIRVTSDCPFIDPLLIDEMLLNYSRENCDYMSNTTPPECSLWPDGSDIEIFSLDALKKSYKECKDEKEREHVTFYIWKNKKTNFKILRFKNKKNLSKFRFTVDYKEDLDVARKIFNYLQENKLRGSANEIANFLKENPKVFEINNKYYAGIGWE